MMSEQRPLKLPCAKCHKEHTVNVFTSINTKDTSLKKSFLNDEINKINCDCGFQTRIEVPILYHDIDNQFAVWYNPLPPELDNKKRVLSKENDYIFSAPTIKEWHEFVGHIMLFENQVSKTQVTKRRLDMKRNYSYENLGSGILSICNEYLPSSVCKYCKKNDASFGLSDVCLNCNKTIKNHSGLKLVTALQIFKLFCEIGNTLPSKDYNSILFEKIDKLSNDFHFLKVIDINTLQQIRSDLFYMGNIGSAHPGYFYKFKNGKFSLLMKGDEELQEIEKIWGMNEDGIIILNASLSVILSYSVKVPFLKRLFK